ncbi:WD repeat-containing protein slp1 [Entomophthora muscae]|uniref:WD repeat-containing protein slp1 n=1 Tax=Entomophthora muscae TaxID=34485 RepID=A0ACC2SI27_9FUNG|nr:WD repeat-containing protein slp1 [Entomophthora muscae]
MTDGSALLESSPLRSIHLNTPLRAKQKPTTEANNEDFLINILLSPRKTPSSANVASIKTPILKRKCKNNPGSSTPSEVSCVNGPLDDDPFLQPITPIKPSKKRTFPQRALSEIDELPSDKLPLHPRPGSAQSSRSTGSVCINNDTIWPACEGVKTVAPSEPATFKPAGQFQDRFIPNRALMCIKGSQAFAEQSELDTTLLRDPVEKRIREAYAQAADITLPTRILTYAAPVESLFNQSRRQSAIVSVCDVLTTQREVPTQPDKTLDAPGFQNDFYTNLFAWSSTNFLAIALKDKVTPDTLVYVWNAATAEATLVGSPFEPRVLSICWSLDGLFLAIGLETGECQIWDLETNEVIRKVKVTTPSPIPSMSWSETLFATGNKSGFISFHDLRLPQHFIERKHAHSSTVCSLEFRSDGAQIASGSNDQYLKVYDMRVNDELMMHKHKAPVKAIAWCPWKPNVLASGGAEGDGQIHTWNTTICSRITSAQTSSMVTSLIWTPKYKELFATHGKPNNSFSIWTGDDLAPVAEVPAHSERILSAALSPDGLTYCTVASDGNLKLWLPFSKPPSTNYSFKALPVPQPAIRTPFSLIETPALR